MIRSSHIEVVATATQLRIFIPSGITGKYTEWIFKRHTNSVKHVDKWVLNLVYAVFRSGDYTYVRRLGGNSIISDNSTWEHAVQAQTGEVVDDDFSGGIAHGWQKLTSFAFLIDGKDWTPATENFKCRNLAVIQECNLFRYKATTGESEDLIAETTEHFDFNASGLTLRQSIRFQTNVKIANSYIGMFPIIRSITGPPAYQVTNRATRNNDGALEDVGTTGFTMKYTEKTDQVRVWGTDSEVSFHWQQTMSTGSEVLTFVSNSSAYNKVYRQACANGADVTSLTEWETEHKFRILT